MYIFLNVSGIWRYSEHSIIIFERRENILSEEKLPMCGCAQSHMYKVAYVLPLISELFIRVCVCVCVCINCCFNGNEVGHYIAQARRFTVAKQYQSSSCCLRVSKQEQTLYPGEPNNGNFRYVNCDFWDRSGKFWKWHCLIKINDLDVILLGKKIYMHLCTPLFHFPLVFLTLLIVGVAFFSGPPWYINMRWKNSMGWGRVGHTFLSRPKKKSYTGWPRKNATGVG